MDRPRTGMALLALLALLASPSAATAQQTTTGSQTGPGHAAPKTDQEKIANALSAAPDAVAREARVVDVGADGTMRVLREGSGTFTCMADNPMSPGNDPMCLDPNGMKWAQAWMSKTVPPADQVGFGYMLQGGSDASNEDPYATGPAPGQTWVDTGPHVMIFNVKGRIEGYPRQHGDASTPYIMWPGTPYEHIMIPVGPVGGTPALSGAQPTESPK